MLYISIWLTLIVCAVMALILVFVRRLTGRIGGYFMAQQTALADLNGYVEEMVNGQKVVKVFCHEEQSKAELHRRNRVWAENAARASGMANSMMPMMNAVGYLQYVIIAVIGGTMAIAGTPNLGLTGMNTLTLGMIASFLTLSRGFTNPISQISNQFNSIVTALAGASRIFAFMDAEPETDDGYVTLVNAKRGKRHARRDRPPHRSLGVEAPARRRHGHIHEACRARRVRSRRLRLYVGQRGPA